MKKLIKAICPNFPEDRLIQETPNSVSWYMIGGNPPRLFVPPINILRRNLLELGCFIEAIKNYETADLQDNRYAWYTEELNLKTFEGIQCIDALEELIQLDTKMMAVDIETHHVGYFDNQLLSIGFATDENTCYALYNIPIKGSNTHGKSFPPSTCYRAFMLLNKLFKRKDVSFIWHNGKFDTNRLKFMCNIDARVDEDTMLKHYACINEKQGTHGLKDLGFLYLYAPMWDAELDKIKKEYCRKNKVLLKDFTYDLIPIEILIPYMQLDCIATYRLLSRLEELKEPNTDFVYRMLIEASKYYGQIEMNGVQVDVMYLEDLEWELECETNKALKEVKRIADIYWEPEKYVKDTGAKAIPKGPFNIKSPAQLSWMIQQLVGFKPESTDAEMIKVLLEFCEDGKIKNEHAKSFLNSITTIRKLSKYMDTYVQGIFKVLGHDGRLRCTYNLHGTETGRLSCSQPNMQNIPRDKKIKNIFKAAKGYKLVQLDYSQAELRVLAILSNDQFLIDTYCNGRDLHDAVATDIFGPDFTKEQRVLAKTVNFGIAYGREASSLAKTFKMSITEARDFINKWFNTVPGAKVFIDTQRNKPLKEEDCISYFGRRRHFIITSDRLYHIQNEYVNTPIQSLASDLTMLSLIEISKWIEENDIPAKIVITVHDSIVLEVKDDEELIKKVTSECTKIMSEVPIKYIKNCPIPFKADAEAGYSWGNLVEVK